ncbi:MAG: amidohydrolase family protein [Bdellovibrionia bacterium]
MKRLIKNGLIVTMNKKRDVFQGDILVEGNKITRIEDKITDVQGSVEITDAADQFVIPGLIQAHTHLVQTLMRGEADDLALLSWLKKKIWPFEAALTAEAVSASARFGVLEMQKNGTTSILDMGTVRHTNALLEAVENTGIRYWGGKCLMDRKEGSGPLFQKTKDALKETEDLLSEWKSRDDLVNYVLCPRFALSCTTEMMEAVADLQRERHAIVHIHASENLDEIAQVKKMTGKRNIEYLNHVKLLNPKTAVVHCVHLHDKELDLMAKTKTPMVHCPSSNLKLGSGIAPIEKYRKRKLKIGLGGDGAPCNNMMDPFKEMHLAALLQKPAFGPEASPARFALELATVGGAQVLGRESEIGSLEIGKLADIVTVDRSHPAVYTVTDPYSALVYSCTGRDVKNVFINGKLIIRNRVFQLMEEELVKTAALEQKKKVLATI